MNKPIILTGALCIISSVFAAGPFGIEKGTKLDSLGKTKETESGKYTFVPQKTLPEFETYVALVSDLQGVCWIKAIGNDIRTSPYGSELTSKFSKFEKKLSNIYGSNKQYDFLLADSMWNEPKDYLHALLEHERRLASVWGPEYNSKMTDDLKSVSLIASATSLESGYIAIEYTFNNYEACKEEISEQVADAL